MEFDFAYNTETFAIDPHVIYFVEQGVDTGFNKEFLASAVESGVDCSGQYLHITRSTRCLCECRSLCLSVCICRN